MHLYSCKSSIVIERGGGGECALVVQNIRVFKTAHKRRIEFYPEYILQEYLIESKENFLHIYPTSLAINSVCKIMKCRGTI